MSSCCVGGGELLGSTGTDSASKGPIGSYLSFLWMKHEERFLSKTSAFKTRAHYRYEAKHPHARLSGAPIRHPRTWHWDPWPIREAGLWKSRNLGIRSWQRVCWHGDTPLQLSWMCMTWACYWGEKLWRAHTCTYVWLELGHWSVGAGSILNFFFPWDHWAKSNIRVLIVRTLTSAARNNS